MGTEKQNAFHLKEKTGTGCDIGQNVSYLSSLYH